MEEMQEKRKKGSVLKKTWERYKSIGGHGQIQRASAISPPLIASSGRPMVKSKSWSTFCPLSPLSPRVAGGSGSKNTRFGPLSPKGCLSVYVGPDRQRFVVKIEYTNHPLFKMLLDKAELEYGFYTDGPLMLPCEVDMFIKILYEIEAKDHDDGNNNNNNLRCKFSRNRSSYHLLGQSSRLVS